MQYESQGIPKMAKISTELDFPFNPRETVQIVSNTFISLVPAPYSTYDLTIFPRISFAFFVLVLKAEQLLLATLLTRLTN